LSIYNTCKPEIGRKGKTEAAFAHGSGVFAGPLGVANRDGITGIVGVVSGGRDLTKTSITLPINYQRNSGDP